jgi:hypothetical protein
LKRGTCLGRRSPWRTGCLSVGHTKMNLMTDDRSAQLKGATVRSPSKENGRRLILLFFLLVFSVNTRKRVGRSSSS